MRKEKHIRLLSILDALSNGVRLLILKYLLEQQSAIVGDIARQFHLSMPAASTHLRILYTAGILERTKRGQYVAYRLSLSQDCVVREVLKKME